jgi:hypothetical protein
MVRGSDAPFRLLHIGRVVDVPVQYFQSVIAIELAVAGALLWQMRFFESRDTPRREGERVPDSRLRLGLAVVLGATVFGSFQPCRTQSFVKRPKQPSEATGLDTAAVGTAASSGMHGRR